MNKLRIGGLVTGLDMEQTVKDLMRAHRARVEKIKQQRQQVEWQRTDYHAVNNSLRALRDAAFNLRLEGQYLAKKAVSSNEAVVAAAAGTGAIPGSHTINVHGLAAGVTKGSQAALPEESSAGGGVKTLAAQFGISGIKTFTLEGRTVDGVPLSKTFNIDTGTYTINTLVSEINGARLGITASYDSAANRFYLATDGTGSDFGIRVAMDDDSFLSDAAGDGTGTLKLLLQTGGPGVSGQDARYDFGDIVNIVSKANTFVLNGMHVTLKAVGSAAITVSRDTGAVYNSIKSFIDRYNSTLETINRELAEGRHPDYPPLTEEQREKLTEKQQDQWEEKARSGMLRNDSLLAGLAGKMRAAMGAVVSGIPPVTVGGKTVTHNSLASVGIVTGHYSEGGRLHLEKEGAVLTEALQNDPDGVMMLFRNNSSAAGEKGIAQRLYDEVNKGVMLIIDRAGVESAGGAGDGSALGMKLQILDNQIKNWEGRLKETEDRYWKQFAALEKAISRMNTQSAWLAQRFGGGSQSG